VNSAPAQKERVIRVPKIRKGGEGRGGEERPKPDVIIDPTFQKAEGQHAGEKKEGEWVGTGDIDQKGLMEINTVPHGNKLQEWKNERKSRDERNRHLASKGIWLGMIFLLFCTIFANTWSRPGTIDRGAGIFMLIIVAPLFIYFIGWLFDLNERSIINLLHDRLNVWVLVNYLVLIVPWFTFPWIENYDYISQIMVFFWISSSPVFIINATGQMWFRYHRFINVKVNPRTIVKNFFLLIGMSFLYITPLILVERNLSGTMETICCFIGLIVVIVHILGSVHIIRKYNALSDKLSLGNHFFFGMEKTFVEFVPLIHFIMCVAIVLGMGGGT